MLEAMEPRRWIILNLILLGGTNNANTAIFSTASGISSGVIAGFLDASHVLEMKVTF
jgi:hypothetical protein